jgi:DNA mismatch endonuclease Vsr
MDRITKEHRSWNMSRIRSKGSKIETLLAKELWKRGYRYRKNNKSVYGTPDLTFKKQKIAIFVDSEFWHGKDWKVKKYEIKSNREFWFTKIEDNIRRDKEVNKELKSQGWKVLRFWGKQISKETEKCINKVENEIRTKQNINN